MQEGCEILLNERAPVRTGGRRRTLGVVAGALIGGVLVAGAWTYVVPREIHTEAVVDGMPDEVWAVLVDVAEYPAWNPAIVSLSGPLEPGATIEVHLVTGGSTMVFRPEALARRVAGG